MSYSEFESLQATRFHSTSVKTNDVTVIFEDRGAIVVRFPSFLAIPRFLTSLTPKMFVVRRLLRLLRRRRGDEEDTTIKSGGSDVPYEGDDNNGNVEVAKPPSPRFTRSRSDSFLMTFSNEPTYCDILAEVKQAEIKRILDDFGLLTPESDNVTTDLSWTKTQFGPCFHDFLRLDVLWRCLKSI